MGLLYDIVQRSADSNRATASAATSQASIVVFLGVCAFDSISGWCPSRAPTCFSFGPIKNLTCIEDGALITRDPHEADQARALRLMGVTQSQAVRIRTTDYQVDGTGWRYHLSAVHAAVGCGQLEQFPAIEKKRKSLWRKYARELATLNEAELIDVDVEHSAPFNCVVRIPNRDQVFATLRDSNIGVGVHYPPNHPHPAFSAWYLPVTAATATPDSRSTLR